YSVYKAPRTQAPKAAASRHTAVRGIRVLEGEVDEGIILSRGQKNGQGHQTHRRCRSTQVVISFVLQSYGKPFQHEHGTGQDQQASKGGGMAGTELIQGSPQRRRVISRWAEENL